MRARIDRSASGVVFAGLLALVVDLSLGWVQVGVYSPGLFGTSLTLDVRATGSGWAGWGIVGGVLAVALLLWHGLLSWMRASSVRAAAVTAALAAATAGFTIAQALTGEADVSADGTLFVTVTRLWPAEAAIGLAAAVVAAAATRLATAVVGRRAAQSRGGRLGPGSGALA